MKSNEKVTPNGEQVTRATHNYLKRKLEELNTLRAKVIDDLGGADFTSLLHDNVAVAQHVQRLDGDIQKIEILIHSAVVLPVREDTSSVGVGNRIKLKFLDEKDAPEEELWVGTKIDASYNAQPITVVSIESPLGKQLVGKAVGETVLYGPEQGTNLRVQILKILPEQIT